jgi:hypothetical protein
MRLRRFNIQDYAVWIALVVLAALMGVLLYSLGIMEGTDDVHRRGFLQLAIERASVECYALEGAYPPNVAYLEDNYGISYDKKRFFVHYRVLGSNLRPEIAVFDDIWEG